MSLLLSTRPQPGGGYGTILVVTVALTLPAGVLNPAWLGADDSWTPPTIADDDGWQPPIIVKLAAPPQAFLADDDFVPVVDEGQGFQPQQPIAYQLSINPVYDNESPAWTIDDEPYLPPVIAAPTLILQPIWGTDEPFKPVVDDDASWLAPAPWKAALPIVSLDTDECVPQPVGDDDSPAQPTIWPLTRGTVFSADDELPSTTTIDDPDGWLARVPPAIVAPAQPVLADDDPPPQPIVEDEPYLPPVRQPSIQLGLVVGGSSATAIVTVPGQPDEDHYLQLILPPAIPTVLFGPWSYAVAEDLSATVDEDYWYSTTAWPIPKPSKFWAEDDIIRIPLNVEDEYWLTPLIQRQRMEAEKYFFLPPWMFEQHESADSLFVPVPPQPRGSIRLRVDREGNARVWYF